MLLAGLLQKRAGAASTMAGQGKRAKQSTRWSQTP
jgi:hypothetical protein